MTPAPDVLGQRIHRARKVRGKSLRALARQVGISHTALSRFEHGQQVPGSWQMTALSRALDVRAGYLLRTAAADQGPVEYRCSQPPERIGGPTHADMLDQLERWHELIDLFPMEIVPSFSPPSGIPGAIGDLDALETVADEVRRQWRLGEAPITGVIDVLESRGILVVQTALDDNHGFNGVSGRDGGGLWRRFIVIDPDWPGDHQRLTLAHELGRLLLRERLTAGLDLDTACHRFAGAFLLPRPAVRKTLGERRRTLERQELGLLKATHGLSMERCLSRALQAGILSRIPHDMLYHDQDPGPTLPREHPVRFRQLVYHALAEDLIGESKAAELLNLPVARFHRERRMEDCPDQRVADP